MLAARNLILTLCGSVCFVQCASKSDGAARHDADAVETRACIDDAGQQCLCAVIGDAATCFENASQVDACGCTPVAPDEAGAGAAPLDADVGTTAPFLGTWTLAGTEQYVCAGEASAPIAESATMTFRAGPGATDASEIDLWFDSGLGCSLAMSVIDGVATLTSAPQTCGAQGKPLDRVFMSVDVSPAPPLGTSLQLDETFTDQSGCTFLMQGLLLR